MKLTAGIPAHVNVEAVIDFSVPEGAMAILKNCVANKTPLYLLTEMLDPNRNVDTRYLEYVASTRAGRTVTGVLAAETATSITLRGQEGREEVLPRAELESLQSSGRSLMPEGLEQFLSKQDLADLIAFLTAPAGR